MPHWSFREMSDAFGFQLDDYLYFGGYPGAVPYREDEGRWRAYIHDSILSANMRRDILARQRVDKPELLADLLQLATGASGQIVSYDKMLGRLRRAGDARTVARYLDLLSDAELVTGLANFTRGMKKPRASHPKLIVLNPALMTAGDDYSFEEAVADRSYRGRVAESAVGAHLYNTLSPNMKLHYWRKGNQEADFVLSTRRHIVGVEVKSGRKSGQVSGLRAFAERYRSSSVLVVGTGGVPLEEFLSEPAEHWLRTKRGSPSKVHVVREGPRAGYGTSNQPKPESGAHNKSRACAGSGNKVLAGVALAKWKTDQYRRRRQRESRDWLLRARRHAGALRTGEGPPWLMLDIASAFWGYLITVVGETGEERVRHLCSGDLALADSAMAGLRNTAKRSDLPGVDEVARTAASGRIHPLAHAFIASLDLEMCRHAGAEPKLQDAQIELALAVQWCHPLTEAPGWLHRLFRSRPKLAATVAVQVAAPAIRARKDIIPAIHDDLFHRGEHILAKRASLPLLRVFPIRDTGRTGGDLDALLWGAIVHADRDQLARLVEHKLALDSMAPGQRVRWLAAGLLVDAKKSQQFQSYLSKGLQSRRVDALAEFLAFSYYPNAEPFRELVNELAVQQLVELAAAIGTFRSTGGTTGWKEDTPKAVGPLRWITDRIRVHPSKAKIFRRLVK